MRKQANKSPEQYYREKMERSCRTLGDKINASIVLRADANRVGVPEYRGRMGWN